MPLITAVDTPSALQSRLRLLVRVRWLGIAFGVVQLLSYDTMPYPAGVQQAGLAIMAGFAVLNLLVALLVARARTERVARLAVLSVVIDLVGISALVYLFAFDPVSALFVLLILVPIEAALLFSLEGAIAGWFGVAVSYVGREWYATTLDNPWETPSVTFRLGLMGIVALIVGLMSRDLQRQREVVAEALEEARRADAWRSRLVAMLAHDLRSPLAGARSGMATLRDLGDRLRPGDHERILDGNIRQLDRMLAMTADLLDLARAEDARLELQLRPVALADVVQRALDLMGDTDVHVDVPADLQVVGDPDRLEQVVANLLSNARRHGAPPVEIVADRHGDEARLAVRDHGPGLPEVLRDRVFEPFATAGDGDAGAGLGSWVIAHIVGLHGGSVAAEDADPGARFVVCLPLDGPRGDAPAISPPPSPRASSGARRRAPR